MNDQTTYPVGRQFSISFNPIEDRLLLITELKDVGLTTLLLTRRMVLLMLGQILNRLPALTDLEQTPVAYWKEVLAFMHQQALEQQRQEAVKAPIPASATSLSSAAVASDTTNPESDSDVSAEQASSMQTFLATELTCQQTNDRLQLAFKGFGVAEPMNPTGGQAPVLALSLKATHIHQFIEILLTHATKANWHLPVDLPWVDVKAGHPVVGSASH